MSTEELDRLLDKATSARVYGRHALAATVWGSAAAAARACYGGETLASVLPCLYQIKKLVLLAQEEKVTAKEVASLRAEALSVFSGLLPYLVRRLDEASLLPGSCTKVEEDWYRRYEVSKRASNGWLPPAPHTLKLIGQGVGYASLIMAAEQALVCLYSPTRPPPEQSEAFQSLVLRTLDIMIPASKTLAIDSLTLGEEKTFAFCLSQTLVPPLDVFRKKLLAKWTSPDLVAMRGQRDLLSVTANTIGARSVAGQREPPPDSRLKHCALPSCDKREASVQQYKFCSGCRSVWYCSPEHASLHWKEHKPTCRATIASKEKQVAAAGGVPSIK